MDALIILLLACSQPYYVIGHDEYDIYSGYIHELSDDDRQSLSDIFEAADEKARITIETLPPSGCT